jgi:hypothetical protein
LLDLSSTTAAKLNLTYPGFGIATLASDSTGALLLQADEANTQASSLIQFKVDGSERVRIDSSGRVGIGTTSPSRLLHLSSADSTSFSSADFDQTYNFLRIVNTTNDRAAGIYFGIGTNGEAAITAAETTDGETALVFGTRGGGARSERARLDHAGRLLVGTSSYSSNGIAVFQGNTSSSTGAGAIDIRLGTTRPTAADTSIGFLRFMSTSDAASNYHYASISAASDGASSSDTDIPGRLVFSTTADGASSPTERMRIGNAGKTNLFDSSGGGLRVSSAGAAGSTDNIFTGFYSATSTTSEGTASIAIRTNGDVRNANNSYGSLSDAKLKENIVNASSQWDDLKALQVRNFNFKEGQTHRQIGLIAQEVELVSPGLVNETPDRDEDGNETGEVTKGVNYSVLYMKAVKALQEAMERIETLEAKVAALEGA